MESINKEKLESLKVEKETFVVQFSASWCNPCRVLSPILENVCDSSGTKVYKFDVASDPEYARQLSITSIPHVKFFKQGEEVASKIGMVPREFYEEQTALLKS